MVDEKDADRFGTFAGITYFGQFIDHDLTRDVTKLEACPVEPNQIRNWRTAYLDLDLVYGSGPGGSPDLYQGDKLKVGATAPVPDADPTKPPKFPGGTLRDIGRTNDGKPLLADPGDQEHDADDRNLENLIVMQIHVLFMKFHNAAVDQCEDAAFENMPLPPKEQKFKRARQLVLWHYQWLVRNYFLWEVCDHDVLGDVQDPTRPKIKWAEDGFFIPAEFSLAAFRFGHSMVRKEYVVNCHQVPVGLVDLMRQGRKTEALREDWLFEWGHLFPKTLQSSGRRVTSSSIINTAVVEPLHHLDEETRRQFSKPSPTEKQPHLPARTLLRGARARLPTGQEVAQELVSQDLLAQSKVLTRDQLVEKTLLTNDDSKSVLAGTWMQTETPLYYYMLKEAEILGQPNRTLGPVGSRIVAEVIEKILWADQDSYLNKVGVGWKLPLWRFRDGTRAPIDSLTRLVKMIGDDLPQGCTATLRSRLSAFAAHVARRFIPIARFIGF
jgi:hypothetical protein